MASSIDGTPLASLPACCPLGSVPATVQGKQAGPHTCKCTSYTTATVMVHAEAGHGTEDAHDTRACRASSACTP